MRTSVWLLVVFALASPACARGRRAPVPSTPAATAPEAPLRELSVAEVAQRVDQHDPTVMVYDVNGRPRYEQGHVPGARWADGHNLTVADLPQDRSKLLVFSL